jgi:DNA mismatch repair protein MutL
MPGNTIALLPDHVANQIAAGEVVQRPASVVKELLENAIDAGATFIQVIIKDAGKTSIQVIDNGRGMGPFDARMCFERHATSKISTAEDLFRLSTKGFRGEALASIAAVAQVELKTRREGDEVAQHVIIDGGKFISQEECQAAQGTTFMVKNLFYNIPARRNFLKSEQIEQKHIIDEVERVAIPHTGIHFILKSNGNEVVNLPAGNMMQRIKALLGSYIQKELVLIGEDTSYVKISGYVSLPGAAIKNKKEQYFFVNNRFVRNPFLNHAVYEAYKEVMSYQSHPRYFIFLDLDPANIDINIHPTKTEVKFSDDKTVYMLLMSSVKRALGKAGGSGSLDFDSEMSIDVGAAAPNKVYTQPPVSYNTGYNPFNSAPQSGLERIEKSNRQHWENLFEGFKQNTGEQEQGTQQQLEEVKKDSIDFQVFQLNNKYIVTTYNQNVMIVDQQRAHERVVYEHYMNALGDKAVSSQQVLFPEQIELGAGDFSLIKDLLDTFRQLGFDIEVFGKNSIVVNGVPGDMQEFNIVQTIEGIIETYKLNTIEARVEKRDNLCRAIARNIAVRQGKQLEQQEMKMLLNSLLSCENPLYTAAGKVVMMDVEYSEIEKFFRK